MNRLRDQVIIVTGSTTGIGEAIARRCAGEGARVLVHGLEADDGARVAADLADRAVFHRDDLADPGAAGRIVAAALAAFGRLDGLVNNAGIMWTPYGTTAQGFEQQLGVNHLGHFALTGRLLPLLLTTERSRVVNVSSLGHRRGRIDFDDLQSQQDYSPYGAYFQSKLANLLFTSELQRRLEAAGSDTIAVAAHPGGSNTNLGHENPGGARGLLLRLLHPLSSLLVQSAARGALPQLRATTDPTVVGDQYYGPDGFGESRGHPVLVDRSEAAKDRQSARRLWEVSEQLTGVPYDSLADRRRG
jgi:NAD(P)-dependent dehydrogenase (short-subunit alcohol dehydrogenase family)